MLNRSKRGVKLRPIILIASAAALLILAKQFPVPQLLTQTLERVKSLGPMGPILFTGIYILATVLFIPGSILTLGAGVLFGVIKGSITVSIAATLGATAAFLVGRYLARGWVSKKIEGNKKFSAIDAAVAEEGWKIVGLTRLSPIFPFTLLNYAYGLTKVSLRDYFFASWVGMIPGTVLYVYIGSLAGDLASLGAGERVRTPEEWIFYGIGLLATVGVTIFVTRIAKKALTKQVA